MPDTTVHLKVDCDELLFVLNAISKLKIPTEKVLELQFKLRKIDGICEFKVNPNSLIGLSTYLISIVPSEQLLDFYRWLKTVAEPVEQACDVAEQAYISTITPTFTDEDVCDPERLKVAESVVLCYRDPVKSFGGCEIGHPMMQLMAAQFYAPRGCYKAKNCQFQQVIEKQKQLRQMGREMGELSHAKTRESFRKLDALVLTASRSFLELEALVNSGCSACEAQKVASGTCSSSKSE